MITTESAPGLVEVAHLVPHPIHPETKQNREHKHFLAALRLGPSPNRQSTLQVGPVPDYFHNRYHEMGIVHDSILVHETAHHDAVQRSYEDAQVPLQRMLPDVPQNG